MKKIRLSQLFDAAAGASPPIVDVANSVLCRLANRPSRMAAHRQALAWLSGLSTAAAAAMVAFAVWFGQTQTEPFQEVLYLVGWAVQ